jgi:hypothetical protein
MDSIYVGGIDAAVYNTVGDSALDIDILCFLICKGSVILLILRVQWFECRGNIYYRLEAIQSKAPMVYGTTSILRGLK